MRKVNGEEMRLSDAVLNAQPKRQMTPKIAKN